MSDRQRDEDLKRFQTEYPDSDFLDAIDQMELATVREIADEVGCAKTTAAKRLRELEDRGEVVSKKVAQTKVLRTP